MSNEYTNKAKQNFFCNADGASNTVKETLTDECGSKSYNFSNYEQYCFNRLPCGICTRTNQMCPFAGNGGIEVAPTCDPLKTPVNPITNPSIWYNTCTVQSTPNPDIEAKN